MSGTSQAWMAPAPSALRLLQARGWDVIMLKRHHAAETQDTLYRTVQRTLQETAALKKSGYRKVVLAGQSFGGYVTLEAVDTSQYDAARTRAGSFPRASSPQAAPINRILRDTVGRLALGFPKNDALFAMSSAERRQAILSRRTSYLLLDATITASAVSGGSPVASRFATAPVSSTSSRASVPAGRFTARRSGEWPSSGLLLHRRPPS